MKGDDLVRSLKARWPDVEVGQDTSPDRPHRVEFSLNIEGSVVDGALDHEGEALILDGELKDCVELALWFRSLVPASQELIFCNEGFSPWRALTPVTTKSEILGSFEGRGPETVR